MITEDDLKRRTKGFSLRVIKLVNALPKNSTTRIIGDQLIRCGTSVGANYRAACRSRSKAEFMGLSPNALLGINFQILRHNFLNNFCGLA